MLVVPSVAGQTADVHVRNLPIALGGPYPCPREPDIGDDRVFARCSHVHLDETGFDGTVAVGAQPAMTEFNVPYRPRGEEATPEVLDFRLAFQPERLQRSGERGIIRILIGHIDPGRGGGIAADSTALRSRTP